MKFGILNLFFIKREYHQKLFFIQKIEFFKLLKYKYDLKISLYSIDFALK